MADDDIDVLRMVHDADYAQQMVAKHGMDAIKLAASGHKARPVPERPARITTCPNCGHVSDGRRRTCHVCGWCEGCGQ